MVSELTAPPVTIDLDTLKDARRALDTFKSRKENKTIKTRNNIKVLEDMWNELFYSLKV